MVRHFHFQPFHNDDEYVDKAGGVCHDEDDDNEDDDDDDDDDDNDRCLPCGRTLHDVQTSRYSCPAGSITG